MKKLITSNITGDKGAPLTKAGLDLLQDSHKEVINMLVRGLVNYNTGDVVILQGCTVTSNVPGTSSITSGAVFYNGEIYLVDANNSIVTTAGQVLVWNISNVDTQETFTDGLSYNYYRNSKITLTGGASGSGIANYNASLKRLDNIVSTVNNLTGVILMWSGAVINIPTGWVLCDGTNGTPDLRGRFIVGQGSYTDISGSYSYNVNDTGGTAKHKLTISEMPIHTHTQIGTDAGNSGTTGNGANDDTSDTGPAGGDAYHENRPPYYALAYIMKI